jgi:hypothetical protein
MPTLVIAGWDWLWLFLIWFGLDIIYDIVKREIKRHKS